MTFVPGIWQKSKSKVRPKKNMPAPARYITAFVNITCACRLKFGNQLGIVFTLTGKVNLVLNDFYSQFDRDMYNRKVLISTCIFLFAVVGWTALKSGSEFVL